jgi:outer membrane scaffolding protein for murein synthesis (MipA/OmpV family)
MQRIAIGLLAGVALIGSAPAGGAVDLTVGLGAAYVPDYEGSDDYKGVPLWNLNVGNLYHPETYVQIIGTTLRSNFLPDDHFQLGIGGRYLADYDNVDDNKVQDLRNTQEALLLGPTLGYDFIAGPQKDLAIELDALYDVEHGNGGVLTPRLRGKMMLAPGLIGEAGVSATWASDDYMSNWFGVNSRDATRAGLDTYNASEGFKDASIGGSLSYIFTPAWSITGIASYTRLLQDAEDSPIVQDQGSENQMMGGLLVNFRF